MWRDDSDAEPIPAKDRDFNTTRWSVVLAAGRRSSPASTRALACLCEAYWYPLYAYVRRRVGDVNEARDLTQAFFAELLEKNYVASATPARGRFRAFLLTAFKHFLSKQRDKAKAKKRGGGRTGISLAFESADARYSLEASRGLSPEQLYERQWAITLLGQIMERLENECAASGKAKQFNELKGFLIGEHAETTYAAAAAKLRMSEAAAKMAAHRMRRRYRQLLRDEIAQTVAGPEEVDDEIRNLFASLEL